MTASTHVASRALDLDLDALYVGYPGMRRCALQPRVQAVPLWAVLPAPAH